MWIEGFLFFCFFQNTLYILYKVSLIDLQINCLNLQKLPFLGVQIFVPSWLGVGNRKRRGSLWLTSFWKPLQLYPFCPVSHPRRLVGSWVCSSPPISHANHCPLHGSSSVAVPALEQSLCCVSQEPSLLLSQCYQPASHPRLVRPDEVLGRSPVSPCSQAALSQSQCCCLGEVWVV